MKLALFTTLDAVLQHGTLAAAAKETNITPSAVSMQMKQLEQYLGQQLFDRSGLQVRPRPLAFDVAATMRQAMDQLEALRLRPTVTVEGTLRLGVIESMQAVLIPGTMRYLRDAHPNLRVLPTRGRTAELTDAVKAGTLDAAVVAQPETGGSARLNWQDLTQRELLLIVPPDETRTSLAALFRDYEWIRYARNTVTGRMAARYINTHVHEKRSTLELDGAQAIVAMVSAGLGIALVQLSDPSICLTYPVRVLRLAGAPRLQFSLVTRKSDADSRPLDALSQALNLVLAQRAKMADVHGMPLDMTVGRTTR